MSSATPEPDELSIPAAVGSTSTTGRLLIAIVAVAGLLASVLCGMGYLHYRSQQLETALSNAQLETDQAASTIAANLSQLEESAKTVEESLDKGSIDRADIEQTLRDALGKNPDLASIGVAFVPFGADPKVRLFAPMVLRKGAGTEYKDAGTFNEYTLPGHDWYNLPLKGGAMWLEPHFGVGSHEFIAQYARPFFYPNDPKTPRGVVFGNYSLENIRAKVGSMELGKTGYAFIISKKGTYVSHPIAEYYKQQRSVYDTAKERSEPVVAQMAKDATQGKSGFVDSTDATSGQSARFYFRPLGNTGLSLISRFRLDEIAMDYRHLQHYLMGVTLGLVAFACACTLLLLRVNVDTRNNIWRGVLFCAVIMMVGIGSIWRLSESRSPYLESANTMIGDRQGVAKFEEHQRVEAKRLHLPEPIFIPTGLFVETVDFTQPYNTDVMGYVWQRYKVGQDDKVGRGLIMPEAVSVSMNEAYRRVEGDEQIIGWQFKATLREQYGYSLYPFDQQDVWVRLWHKDIRQNVWLVPDLSSYDQMSPSSLPGLEHDLVLAGWKLRGTFYDYKPRTYNTNFGVTGGSVQHDVPELHFNILMQRNFIGPFISSIIPLLMVSLMLFSTMMSVNLKDKPWVVIGSIASSFFTIVLAHSKVRDTFGTSDIIYLEYFYLVMYCAVGFVSINSFLYATETKLKLINTRDNLLPRLCYWPALVGSILVITTVVFW